MAVRPGGTVAALATVSTAGMPVVFAATPVGVFRSADRGQSWRLTGTDRLVPFAEGVFPAPNFAQDRTVFMCADDGLYRSFDGQQWQPVLVGARMLSAAVARQEGDQCVVLAGTDADGILRSEDGGRTWRAANAGLLDFTALCVALSPNFQEDHLAFAGTPSGLYRSRNGARSWRKAELGLSDPVVQCLALSPTWMDDGLVLAGSEADGLLRSEDGGSTWRRVESLTGNGVTAIALAGAYPATPSIAAATEAGVAVSLDAGRSWRIGAPLSGAALSLTFVPPVDGAPELLLAGLHRYGVVQSADDGATWQSANTGLNARLASGLVLSAGFARDQTLFIFGPQDGVSVSVDGGWTWDDGNHGLELSTCMGLAAPQNSLPPTVYAATTTGVYVTRDACATWQRSLATEARAVAAGGKGTVVAALVDGTIVGSTDDARTWRTLGQLPEGGEVLTLALSPSYGEDATIFVSTISNVAADRPRQLTLWYSGDAGQRWQRWLAESGPVASLSAIATSAGFPSDQLVFVALGGQVLRRRYRTSAWAESTPVGAWQGTDIGGGKATVTALAVSPSFSEDATVIAAARANVFVSHDGGEHFEDCSGGIDSPAVVGLAVSPNYGADGLVYALSVDGTVWRRRIRD